jgi:hypothetical protein
MARAYSPLATKSWPREKYDPRSVWFNLDGKVHIGARQIEAPLSLAHKSALQQSGGESRIDLKRSFRVTQREVRFRTAQIQPRAAGVGLQPIIRWTRRIIDHR